jgi:hypothetical protein
MSFFLHVISLSDFGLCSILVHCSGQTAYCLLLTVPTSFFLPYGGNNTMPRPKSRRRRRPRSKSTRRRPSPRYRSTVAGEDEAEVRALEVVERFQRMVTERLESGRPLTAAEETQFAVIRQRLETVLERDRTLRERQEDDKENLSPLHLNQSRIR